MILVDTSIWADHLRSDDPQLRNLLDQGDVLSHPFVTGELAMGFLKRRDTVMKMLHRIQEATVAREGEVLRFVVSESLFGRGISYIDAHLLASARLTPDAFLWTRGKRLHAAATTLGLAFQPDTIQ